MPVKNRQLSRQATSSRGGGQIMNDDAQTQALVYSDFANDPDFAEILQMFMETIPERRQSIEEAHRDGEIEQVQSYAHQLKGAGGSYGFEGLTAAAAGLEDACRAGDIDGVFENLDRLLNYMSRMSM